MTIEATGAEWRPYLRALGEAGIDIVSAGAWIAAAELPPARRRIARTALTAAIVAVSLPGIRAGRSAASAASTPTTQDAEARLPFVDVGIRLPDDEPSGTNDASRKRKILATGAAALTAAAAVSIGAAAAGRRLERRWLARLTRHGHPHPHRALAVRVAALYAVVVVPSRLLAVRQEAIAGRETGSRAKGDPTGSTPAE